MGYFKIVTLHDSFHTKQHHFTLSNAPAHHFFSTFNPHKVVRTGHLRTMASLVTPFQKTCRHAHKALSVFTWITATADQL